MAKSTARATFRHGNLPEALVEAALDRLEASGAESISLRDLAGDVGVNHRAVYRHFPDKLSVLARVAEVGWVRLARRIRKETAGKAPGEATVVAAGVGLFLFARECPNLFYLMAGARVNVGGRFPVLEATMSDTMATIAQGFRDSGTAPDLARERAAIYLSALQGIVAQILHRRLHVTPAKARGFVAATSKMLFDGMR